MLALAAALLVLAAAAPDGDWISILSRASGPVLMAIIIVGAIRKTPWWVPGEEHRRVVRERDRLLELALNATQVTDRVVSLAEDRTPPA